MEIIIIAGPPSCGKTSYVADHYADVNKYQILSADELMANLAALHAPSPVPKFDKAWIDYCSNALYMNAALPLEYQRTVVIDGLNASHQDALYCFFTAEYVIRFKEALLEYCVNYGLDTSSWHFSTIWLAESLYDCIRWDHFRPMPHRHGTAFIRENYYPAADPQYQIVHIEPHDNYIKEQGEIYEPTFEEIHSPTPTFTP